MNDIYVVFYLFSKCGGVMYIYGITRTPPSLMDGRAVLLSAKIVKNTGFRAIARPESEYQRFIAGSEAAFGERMRSRRHTVGVTMRMSTGV